MTHDLSIRGILYCPHRFLWKARQYGHRSHLSFSSNQTKFFKKIGFYTEQWRNLYRFLGFWNRSLPTTNYTDFKNNGGRASKNYKIFIKKKKLIRTTQDWELDLIIYDLDTHIKYVNKPNGGFNITLFSHMLDRLVSVHPGKSGIYVGSSRRKSKAIFSWWHYLFTVVDEKIANESFFHQKYVKEEKELSYLRQNLFINIYTTNTSFLKYFFVFKSYINAWPNQNISILLGHNFKKLNLILKKKRYMKKFKRKFLLPSDRINRQVLLVRPHKNTIMERN